MYKLGETKRFLRKYLKLVKHDRKLEAIFNNSLELLADNPSDRKLKTHKVLAFDGRKAFSSRVTGDLRIIWRFKILENGEEEIEFVALIDVGGHEGGKKVYK